jgi:hypothetical protein
VFIQAIHDVGAKSHFVPIGEADGVCAVLAERLGGYLMGQDSDFAILMGEGGRSKGYVPFDMMSWFPGPEEDVGDPATGGEDVDSEFTPVSNGRQQRRIRESSLLPPSDYRNPILNLVIYPPSALRTRLRLPSNVLPLFASLCGTDYTPPQASFHFFEPTLKLVQRIEKVARVLREQLYSPSAPKARTAGDHAADLVARVIKKLLVRDFQTEGEGRMLVDAIVDATLQYTLPTLSRCCEHHPFCGVLDIGCQSESVEGVKTGVKEYAEANTRGEFKGTRHAYLYPGMVHLNQVLEDPNRASIKLQGLVQVRKSAWEIVDEVMVLRFVSPEAGEGSEEEKVTVEMDGVEQGTEKDVKAKLAEDDIMDDRSERTLVEDDYERLGGNGMSTTSMTDTDILLSSSTGSEPESKSPQRIVTEYVRSSNRIIAHSIHLATPSSDAPRALQPLSHRLSIYLSALQANTPLISSLPLPFQPIIAIIRFCIIDSPSSSSSSTKDAWRAAEVTALLQACLGTYFSWQREERGDCPTKQETTTDYPFLTNRNAQLAAHLQAVMTDSHLLAEALLLSGSDTDKGSESELTHLRTYKFYSGSTIHRFLQKLKPEGWKWSQANQEIYELCLSALVEGIEDRIIGWNVEVHAPTTDADAGETVDLDVEQKEVVNGRKRKEEDGAKPTQGEEKVGKTKKKGGKSKKGSKGQGQGHAQGRFDLLNGLTE